MLEAPHRPRDLAMTEPEREFHLAGSRDPLEIAPRKSASPNPDGWRRQPERRRKSFVDLRSFRWCDSVETLAPLPELLEVSRRFRPKTGYRRWPVRFCR